MIFQPEFFLAFTIGFFGSLHCIGMCGPIALSVPNLSPTAFGKISGAMLYNSGRVMTYGFLGMLAGSLGKGFALFRWQQGLSIAMGMAIIIYLIFPKLVQLGGMEKWALQLNSNIKAGLGHFLRQKTVLGLIGLGLVNGLLPCGLVYLALAGSIDQSSMLSGAVFMVFFGLGTWPMMLGVNFLGHNLKGTFKNKLSKVIPIFAFAVGVLFILRGLGLGIPYVSPSYDSHAGDINCHVPEHRH